MEKKINLITKNANQEKNTSKFINNTQLKKSWNKI